MNNINTDLFDRFMLVNRRIRQTGGPSKKRERVCSPLAHREIILVILHQRETCMKQQEIADEIYVSKSTLSEMIDRLSRDGYLERADDPSDRRNTIVALTERGRQRAEAAMEEHAREVEFLFRPLSEPEKAELLRLLEKLSGEETEED